METFDDVRTLWRINSNLEIKTSYLNREAVEKVIKSRIRKERKAVAEYFRLSLAFQVFIYLVACFLFVRFRDDAQVIIFCAAGVLLYIPLTFILMRKFKSMLQPITDYTGDIKAHVKNQYELLTQFFGFKKRFDLVAIPVNSLVLVGVLFNIYVPGGIESNLVFGALSFVVMALTYSIAAWLENKKHFVMQLRRFEVILEDMKISAQV